jgi:hypothetical protein
MQLRMLLLGCILCGLIQKPLISFAWDVQALEEVLCSLDAAKASDELMGGTAILLRQVFAARGQRFVGDMALALAGSGSRWTKRSLKHLQQQLLQLAPTDAGT